MKTLFLHPPSFDGFDGGAGSRYQAKREIRSFWYPTWLAQPAALVPGSRLLDAPADGLRCRASAAARAGNTSSSSCTPARPRSRPMRKFAELLKEENPHLQIGMVGAKVAVDPAGSLGASAAIDFVAREEFDYTCKEVAEGRDSGHHSRALLPPTRRHDRAQSAARPMIENMDELPWVAPVYKRDLTIENYFIGYLQHPYVSLLHGTRLPLQVHLLPVAADRRRPSLPRAQRRRTCSRRCAGSRRTCRR